MAKVVILKSEHDLSDLVELSKSFFKEYEQYDKGYFKLGRLKEEQIREFFLGSINSENCRTAICVEDDRMLGYVTFSVKNREPFYEIRRVGYISGVMVDEKHRNKGVGKLLLNEAKKWFKKKKLRYFYLETSAKNKLGIEFYERNKMSPLKVQYIGDVE
jgi:ribosomal protein S18 acetylase RimI-like enzyme